MGQDSSNGHGSPSSLEKAAEADTRKNRRLTFDFLFAFVYIIALHGSSAFKILVILYINYTVATQLRRDLVPFVTWIFNISILFANELCKGYPYADVAGLLRPSTSIADDLPNDSPRPSWGFFLDSYGGLIPRWEVLFNITVLRLISFNLDYYWSQGRTTSNALEVHRPPPISKCQG